MKKLVSLIALTFSASATIPAHAWTVTSLSNITYLENGWAGEGLVVKLNNGYPGCPATDTEFAVLSTHPSYKDIIALATSAFMASTNVELVIEPGDCVFGDRTKIISIRLYK